MTDFTNPPPFQTNWEGCGKITAHTLKHYMRIVEEDESTNIAELKGGMTKIVNLTDLQAVLLNDLLCKQLR